MQWHLQLGPLTLQEECAELALWLHGFDAKAVMVRAKCRAQAGDFWGAQEDFQSLDYTQVWPRFMFSHCWATPSRLIVQGPDLQVTLAGSAERQIKCWMLQKTLK